MTAAHDSDTFDQTRPLELEHDTIWRDARYWLALQGRFIVASPFIGGGALATLIGGVVLEHIMVVRMLVATGMITDALVKHRGTSVQTAVSTLAISSLLFLIGILAAWFGRYAYQILWRTHFTQRLLARWLADNRYLHLEREGQVGNPEQRIQEDLYSIGYWTVWLIPFFIGAISSGTYAWVLIWRMSYPLSFAPLGLPVTIPLGLFTACLTTAIVRVVGAHLAGARITRFEIIRKSLDADFRHQLAEVREYGEGVAFQRGAEREERRALSVFNRIRSNWWRLTTAQMTLSTANGVTSSLSRLIPPLVCIQPILSGQLSIGKLVVATATFTLAMQLISVFADEYSTIAWLRASVARVRLFERVLAEPIATGPQIETSGSGIEAANLAITLPDGTPLLAVSSFAAAPGERLAISGRSGSGKSSLLRTLAGLWPHAEGRVWMPLPERVMFLPQRPFLPNDTLAAVLSYPDDSKRFNRDSYLSALDQCGLSTLAPRLDEIAAWRKQLSPGEQQRLGAARALLRQPEFLVMDEPTSALDPASEAEIYHALEAGLPDAAFVTVAHSRQLLDLHGRRVDVACGVL